MFRLVRYLSLVVLALLFGQVAFSQEEPAVRIVTLAGFLPQGGGMVPGAPYSAVQEFEESQTLKDGTRIVNRRVSKVYRDFQGRIRLELFMGREVPEEPNIIEILDPVLGVHYTLFVKTRLAKRTPMPKVELEPAQVARPANRPSLLPPTPEREPLGTQMIEGFLTEGVRTTHTLPAGALGNDQPMTTVTETWYSDELKPVLLTKRSDPRSDTVNRLTQISRVEPSAALFEVPPDYTIEEGRP